MWLIMKDIKSLKPRKGSWTKQGYLDPKSCKKLFPGFGNDIIIFRSEWERKYAIYCENNPNIRYWASECMEIPYIMDGKKHIYHPDFVVEFMNGRRVVVEIKPESQCRKPLTENSWLWNAYKTNIYKWMEAKSFCEARGMDFVILTEKTINAL